MWSYRRIESSSSVIGGTFQRFTIQSDAGGIYIDWLVGSNSPEEIVKSVGPSRSDSAQRWIQLAADYERARSRDDSLDRLVEWPAQRECLGDITGRSVLDVGCGNGGKLAELVRAGAVASVGVDISGSFITNHPSGLELVQADLSDLDSSCARGSTVRPDHVPAVLWLCV